MQFVGIVLVHNEDVFVERAIRNVAAFCDRIYAVDHLSNDRTPEILRRLARELDHLTVQRSTPETRIACSSPTPETRGPVGRPFDVVVADDGSGPDTAAVVEGRSGEFDGRLSQCLAAGPWLPASAGAQPWSAGPRATSSCSWTVTVFRGATSCGRCTRASSLDGSCRVDGSSSRTPSRVAP